MTAVCEESSGDLNATGDREPSPPEPEIQPAAAGEQALATAHQGQAVDHVERRQDRQQLPEDDQHAAIVLRPHHF
jgi:hypothetical protein